MLVVCVVLFLVSETFVTMSCNRFYKWHTTH